MENSSTNGKDATPSNMETQNAKNDECNGKPMHDICITKHL